MYPGVGTRVRPRPIDHNRKLAIYRDVNGLVFDEDVPAELSQAKQKGKIDLPTPAVEDVADYGTFTAKTFVPTPGFVRRPVVVDADAERWTRVEYDADYEDEVFLATHPRLSGGGDPALKLELATFERIIDVLEHTAAAVDGAAITIQEAVHATLDRLYGNGAEVKYPLPPHCGWNPHGSNAPYQRVVEDVMAYWNAKRGKWKKPLLRRYWPVTVSTDRDPHHTFRPHERTGYRLRRQTRRNDLEVFHKMESLLDDVRMARQLAQLCNQREAIKRDLIAVSEDVFEQLLDSVVNVTGPPRKPITLPKDAERRPVPKIKLTMGRGRRDRGVEYAPSFDAETTSLSDAMGAGDSYMDDDGTVQGDEEESFDEGMALPKKQRKAGAGGPGRPGVKTDTAAAAAAARKKKEAMGVGGAGALAREAARARARQQAPTAAQRPTVGLTGGTVTIPTMQGPAHAYSFGLDPQQRDGEGLQPAVAFKPGYRGMRLGPWSMPRTIPPHHQEDAHYDPADTLGMGAASGLRIGPFADVVQSQAAMQGIYVPLLPSRNSVFPMDGAGYAMPADREVYRADATVQRRMLTVRNYQGLTGVGAIAWEEGTGSGLVPGFGANIGMDGRGWESLCHRPEAAVLPLDDVGGSDAYGYLPPSSTVAPPSSLAGGGAATVAGSGGEGDNVAREGRGDGDGGEEVDGGMEVQEGEGDGTGVDASARALRRALALVGGRGGGSSTGAPPATVHEIRSALLVQAESDEAWLSSYLHDMTVPITLTLPTPAAHAPPATTATDVDATAASARKRRRVAGSGVAGGSPCRAPTLPGDGGSVTIVPPPPSASPPNYILRPRMSRGGRLVLDRIRLKGNLHAFAAANAHALRERKAAMDRLARRAWRMAFPATATQAAAAGRAGVAAWRRQRARPLHRVHVDVAGAPRGTTAAAWLTPSRLPVSSVYELREAYGYMGAPTDPHALHLASFGHYKRSGEAVVSSMLLHSEAVGDDTSVTGSFSAPLAPKPGQADALPCHAPLAPSVRRVAGLSTSFLAPSRFTRLHDEMAFLHQHKAAIEAQAAAAVAKAQTPGAETSTSVAFDALPDTFDPFYDDAVEELTRLALAAKPPTPNPASRLADGEDGDNGATPTSDGVDDAWHGRGRLTAWEEEGGVDDYWRDVVRLGGTARSRTGQSGRAVSDLPAVGAKRRHAVPASDTGGVEGGDRSTIPDPLAYLLQLGLSDSTLTAVLPSTVLQAAKDVVASVDEAHGPPAPTAEGPWAQAGSLTAQPNALAARADAFLAVPSMLAGAWAPFAPFASLRDLPVEVARSDLVTLPQLTDTTAVTTPANGDGDVDMVAGTKLEGVSRDGDLDDELSAQQLAALVAASVPRDAYGIPLLGAHTGRKGAWARTPHTVPLPAPPGPGSGHDTRAAVVAPSIVRKGLQSVSALLSVEPLLALQRSKLAAAALVAPAPTPAQAGALPATSTPGTSATGGVPPAAKGAPTPINPWAVAAASASRPTTPAVAAGAPGEGAGGHENGAPPPPQPEVQVPPPPAPVAQGPHAVAIPPPDVPQWAGLKSLQAAMSAGGGLMKRATSIKGLAAGMRVRDEAFTEWWGKEEDSDDDELVQAAYHNIGPHREIMNTAAVTAYEEGVLRMLLEPMVVTEGT